MLDRTVPCVTFRTRVRDAGIEGPDPFRREDKTSADYFAGRRVLNDSVVDMWFEKEGHSDNCGSNPYGASVPQYTLDAVRSVETSKAVQETRTAQGGKGSGALSGIFVAQSTRQPAFQPVSP